MSEKLPMLIHVEQAPADEARLNAVVAAVRPVMAPLSVTDPLPPRPVGELLLFKTFRELDGSMFVVAYSPYGNDRMHSSEMALLLANCAQAASRAYDIAKGGRP